MRVSYNSYTYLYYRKGTLETRIIIKVIIKTKKVEYKVRVLINLGIKVNYIKKKLTLEISITLILGVTPLVVLDENRIYLYRDYILGVITKDIISN
jgi:hypothetical protein